VSRARRELYVYYRVGTGDVTAALRLIEQAQALLQAEHPNLTARLLRRADEPEGDSVTLMETYRAKDGIDAALQRRIEEAMAELGPLLTGTRHAEVFALLAAEEI
jgi:quinol monooxygenase YgiN